MTTRRHPLVCLVNHSSVVSDDQVAAAIVALQHQVSFHFMPHWNAGCTLLQVQALTHAGLVSRIADGKEIDQHTASLVTGDLPAGAWLLVIADDSDQAGALGYHEVDPKTTPIGYVFAKTDQQAKLSWTVTASHELLEMLGDPLANQTVQIKPDGTSLAYETADAVEADQDGYKIGDVLVSNFVYPSWFVAGSPGPWDYRGLCKAPLELRPGGYIGVWRPKTGWTQVTQHEVDGQVRGHEPRHDEGPRFRMRRDGHGLPAAAQLPAWADWEEKDAATLKRIADAQAPQ